MGTPAQAPSRDQGLPAGDRSAAPLPLSWRRRLFSQATCLTVLLLGLALTALASNWLVRDAQTEGQLRFGRYADKLDMEVSARFARVQAGFRGLRSHFDASEGPIQRDNFRTWVASRRILDDMPGIRGIGFIGRVARPDLAAFVAAERADAAPGFAVKTTGDAPDLFVIKFIEPLANNERAWGYDVGSEPVRRAAAERAVATGEPALTRRITLVQDGKKRPGYLYFLPVFRWGSARSTPEDRQRNLVGLIYAPIVMEEFLQGIGQMADRQLDMQLYDGDQAQSDKLVFDLGLGGHTMAQASAPRPSRFALSKRLDIGGHSLLLSARSTAAFEGRFDSWDALWFGLSGAMLSVLVTVTMWLLMLGRARAETMAQHMTADLSRAKLQAEASLRESARLLDTMQRFSLMSITDREGRIIEVNEAFCHRSGHAREALLGQNHRILQSGLHESRFWQGLWAAILRGEAWQGEVCNRARDGSLYWVKNIVVPMLGVDGEIERFVSIQTDITDSKRNEQELHDMAERYQLAIDGGNDGLWDWFNVNDHKMWWSPQLYRLLGYEPDEFPASLDAFERLLHPDTQAQALATIEGALKHTSPLDAMYQLRTKDGSYRWFRGRGKVFFDADGYAQRMAGSMQDVHDRRMAEQIIQDHSEQLGAIFALSPDGFVSFGADGRVSYVSAAFGALTGLSTDAVQGMDEAQFVQALLALALDSPVLKSLDELTHAPLKHDPMSWLARHRLVLALASPPGRMLALSLQQAKGQAVSRLLLVRDVTHEAEVDRVKSAFLSMAAHELRTPMSSIYGFVELLLTREFKPDKQKELLGRVFRQSELMISIINELLDLARIESRGGADFDYRPANLVELVDEVVTDFKRPPEREAPLVSHPAHTVLVQVDHLKMGQAVLNVLSNAYKYSPQGGPVRVSFPQQVDDDGTRWVAVCVSDEGMGMSPEQLAHMGERFFRADKSGNIPGTGLGMSIVKQMLELMGGRLAVQSEMGQGTAVTLWLPAHTESPVPQR
jgi:PAS domain S-box-containing protein